MARTRILFLSLLSGTLWALSWPAIGGMTWLAFVAWLPLLHAERLHDRRGDAGAFTPWVLPALFLWNLSCSYWFAMVSEPIMIRAVSVTFPVLTNTLLMAIPWWLKRLARKHLGQAWAGVMFVVSWLAYERLDHDWDMQWPWFTLGNVFGTRPGMVQWYEFTGVLGGSLWIMLVAFALDHVLHMAGRRPRAILTWGAIAAGAIALPYATSVLRYEQYHIEQGAPVQVVVVQPNVDPYLEKFGGVDPLEQLERMLAQAEEVMDEGTVLVVFPETALQENATVSRHDGDLQFNGLWENDLQRSRSVQRIRRFQQQHPGVAVVAGMSSARHFRNTDELPLTARPLGDGRHWYESYNAALWMPVEGQPISYHKSKLVAGVESMPFEQVLGPLGHLALDLGGTTGSLGQQEERSVLRDPASDIALIPAICYESVFGEHIAAHVRNGGNLIVVMTNDGWWGDSPGYGQHLTFSSLRAIESRRDVVRSANTGISCTIDQRGTIHDRTKWWSPVAFRATVYLNDKETFFVRYGDLIGRIAVWMTMALILLMPLARLLHRRPG